MMSEDARHEPAHRRPHAPPMASPFLEFDLTAEVTGFAVRRRGRRGGTPERYEVRRSPRRADGAAGERRIREHTSDGRISVHMLSGHIRLNASGRTFDLRPGSLVALDRAVARDRGAGRECLPAHDRMARQGAAHEMTPLVVFTIGHSTRAIEEFIRLLKAHGVQRVIDVRTIPRSRHNPQFNRDQLSPALHNARIHYRHMPGLGGLRHARRDSANTGWRNASFRGYADYMQTAAFEESLARCLELAKRERVVLMCAEAVPWRCHRSLIADALLVRGDRCARDHQRHSRAASRVDAVGAGERHADHVSCGAAASDPINHTAAVARSKEIR